MKPYYEELGIKIFHGDCREIMGCLPKNEFDAVITDPPYGLGIASWDVADDSWVRGIEMLMTENSSLFHFWSVAKLLDAPRICGLVYERCLVWSKPMTLSNQRAGMTWHWEPIFWWKKGKPSMSPSLSDVLTFNPVVQWNNPERVAHPTQKPIALMRKIIGHSASSMILDPFMGSGTTLVAAKQLGIKTVGIEQDENYCEIAANRLRQSVLQFD